MRLLLALAVSTALIFGCSDSNDAGTGGSGGDGGSAGAGGAGGMGGAVGTTKSTTYVLLSPIPPCAEGTPSDYGVDIFGDAIASITGTFAGCSDLIDSEQRTITCSNENAGTNFEISVNEGSVPDTSVVIAGTFPTCSGAILGQFEEVGAGDEMLVDFHLSPNDPCEEGVPSDYTVEVFVDGMPGAPPASATASFEGCTGTIDGVVNTITCANDMEAPAYTVIVGEGSDREVTVNGNWETCGAFFFHDSL